MIIPRYWSSRETECRQLSLHRFLKGKKGRRGDRREEGKHRGADEEKRGER